MIRTLVVVALVVGVGAAAIYAYRAHDDEKQLDSDAPVVAPTRVVEQNGEATVRLDSAGLATSRLGLAALMPVSRASRIELRAIVVIDPDAVTTIRAPVSGRLAASGTWPSYGTQLESGGELGTVSDARPVVLSRGGTVSRVFVRPGAIVQAGDPLIELTDFGRPVVMVAWADEAPAIPPQSVTLTISGQSVTRSARLLGPAPEADPVTRRAAYLYRLEGRWSAARPGLLLDALIPSGNPSTRGVLIPSAALVQWDGLEWAWIKRAAGSFVRMRVPTDRAVPGGWLAPAPWRAGDSVVVVGAEQLLSEEFRARVSVGDEVAE
ncbi:MAG: HlyD family efflux transporter periplasmic adaptor subunit [Gemmatimonadota bacterium]